MANLVLCTEYGNRVHGRRATKRVTARLASCFV